MACSESSENIEMSQNKADDEFVPVLKQSRKRKQNEEAMDTNVVSMKRPHLPPLSGDKLLVCHAVVFVSVRMTHVIWYFQLIKIKISL